MYYSMIQNSLKKIWWLSPSKLIIYFIIPIYFLSNWAMLNSKLHYAYNELTIYFDGFLFYVGLAFLILMALMSFLGERVVISKTPENNSQYYLPLFYLKILMFVSLLAYLIFSINIIKSPGLIFGYFKGEVSPYLMKDLVNIHSGITTFTQISPLVIYFYLISNKLDIKVRKSKFLKIVALLILVFTFFRGMLFSERLAIIEIILPIFMFYLKYIYKPVFIRSFLLNLLPYVGVVLLYFVFIAAEYNRSWLSHYNTVFDNVWEFGYVRLAMYYVTSINNGYMLLERAGFFGGDFTYIFSWLYKLPIVGAVFYDYIGADFNAASIISTYSTLEFNNPSGIFIYFLDLSYFGFLIAVLFGCFFGVSYRKFIICSRSQFIYPIYFVSLLEILRVPYIFEGRNFPIILTSIFVYFCCKKYEHEHEHE